MNLLQNNSQHRKISATLGALCYSNEIYQLRSNLRSRRRPCIQRGRFISPLLSTKHENGKNNSTNIPHMLHSELQGWCRISSCSLPLRFQMHPQLNQWPLTTTCVTSVTWSPSPLNPDNACPLLSWATDCAFAFVTITIMWIKFKAVITVHFRHQYTNHPDSFTVCNGEWLHLPFLLSPPIITPRFTNSCVGSRIGNGVINASF